MAVQVTAYEKCTIYTHFHNIHIANRVLKRLEYGWKWQTSISCRIITNTKGPCTSSPKLSYAVFYFHFFIFVILSYQNKCNGCENAENRSWSEFLYDGRIFRRQCVNVIDTAWGRIYFFYVKNVKTNVYILVLAKSCLPISFSGLSCFVCSHYWNEMAYKWPFVLTLSCCD